MGRWHTESQQKRRSVATNGQLKTH